MYHECKMPTYQLKCINFSHKTLKPVYENGNNFNDFVPIMTVHMKTPKKK